MRHLLLSNKYDLVSNMLPTPDNHGEHQAATILVLEAISSLPLSNRPIVIGGTNPVQNYRVLPGYPLTSAPSKWRNTFDRKVLLKETDTISYMLIVAWNYACHKSQTGLQMDLVSGLPQKVEYYWSYDINAKLASYSTFLDKFFTALATTPYNIGRL